MEVLAQLYGVCLSLVVNSSRDTVLAQGEKRYRISPGGEGVRERLT